MNEISFVVTLDPLQVAVRLVVSVTLLSSMWMALVLGRYFIASALLLAVGQAIFLGHSTWTNQPGFWPMNLAAVIIGLLAATRRWRRTRDPRHPWNRTPREYDRAEVP